ncbi:MAG TPA: MotA/TolQ/ExbB proton channel family protein [Hyphomicrobiaceae bacterium]|nr:MotA/TolQ/ExbB proton channel family protein [Hyphomicrobiaceae bacterium]
MGETVAVGVAHDLSLTSLLLNADPVVQGVIALLVLASIMCWALIFEKLIRILGLKSQVRMLEQVAHGAALPSSLDNGYASTIVAAGEFERQVGHDTSESVNDIRLRVERAMRGAVRGELKRIETGLPFLATVGSAAPFIGLFGTVWGIMHSFTAIAQAKDTSLAVVAPGIAEALFATAIGLAAAIPAVIAYNQISVALGRASERTNAAVHRIAPRFLGGRGVSAMNA